MIVTINNLEKNKLRIPFELATVTRRTEYGNDL